MGHSSRSLPLLLAIAFVPALAFAQNAETNTTTTTTTTVTSQTVAAPAPPAPGSGSAAPAGPAPSSRGATGYGWTSPPAPDAPRRVYYRPKNAADALLPGFEVLPDGSSRLFVQLSKPPVVTEKKAKGTITYVLKSAFVPIGNNRNALVTVHFNTPVTRARLVPAGADLHFVLDMRADVSPTWKVVSAKDGFSILQIDLPKGNYIPSALTEGQGR